MGSGGRLISLSGLAEIHQRASHNVLIIAKPIIAILFVFLFVIVSALLVGFVWDIRVTSNCHFVHHSGIATIITNIYLTVLFSVSHNLWGLQNDSKKFSPSFENLCKEKGNLNVYSGNLFSDSLLLNSSLSSCGGKRGIQIFCKTGEDKLSDQRSQEPTSWITRHPRNGEGGYVN